ncbi:MAG TPA: divalent-cation tolerance protein CutA [Acidimicrobiales bacterium]|nr:divalent-cation tolerance protein CutA [Acidimicrobiales bacterium]
MTTTAGSEEEAARIADALLERRLAACVQALPITSRYEWKGKVALEREVLLLVKTREDRFEEVRAAITELHSYEVPEILLLPVTAGAPPYLAWLDEAVAP